MFLVWVLVLVAKKKGTTRYHLILFGGACHLGWLLYFMVFFFFGFFVDGFDFLCGGLFLAAVELVFAGLSFSGGFCSRGIVGDKAPSCDRRSRHTFKSLRLFLSFSFLFRGLLFSVGFHQGKGGGKEPSCPLRGRYTFGMVSTDQGRI